MSKILNSYYNKIIYINEGEEICPKCKGKGRVPKNGKILSSSATMMLRCNICSGDGKIDWVEKVVGKKVKVYDKDIPRYSGLIK